METINVGIIGGAGYTGGELLRILINHPFVNITFVYSNSQAGKPVWATHTDLLGDTDLTFTGDIPSVAGRSRYCRCTFFYAPVMEHHSPSWRSTTCPTMWW